MIAVEATMLQGLLAYLLQQISLSFYMIPVQIILLHSVLYLFSQQSTVQIVTDFNAKAESNVTVQLITTGSSLQVDIHVQCTCLCDIAEPVTVTVYVLTICVY